jgi:hypothetical protein
MTTFSVKIGALFGFPRLQCCHASINNVSIKEMEHKFHWSCNAPRQPDDHPGLKDLGLPKHTLGFFIRFLGHHKVRGQVQLHHLTHPSWQEQDCIPHLFVK